MTLMSSRGRFQAEDSFRHCGRIQSNLPFFIRFFISEIGVIRGRSTLFLVAAERGEAAQGASWFQNQSQAGPWVALGRSFRVDDFLQLADGPHPEHLHGGTRAAHAFGDFVERQTLEVAEDDHLLVVLGEL